MSKVLRYKVSNNFILFYPYRIIEATFNRFNLRLSQESWSLGYILI